MLSVGATARQADLLAFITAEIEAGRQAPSFDEMAAHLGLRSKSGIHRLVSGLEQRGQIVRLAHCTRAIGLPGRQPMPAAAAATVPAATPDTPACLVIPKPIADRVAAYSARRGRDPSEVVAAALRLYMTVHP